MWQSVFNISGRALASLLVFLGRLLGVLARITTSPLVNAMAMVFPKSTYIAHKLLAIPKHSFTVYVVCAHCYSIHKVSDCTDENGRIVPKRCDKLAFPNHRQAHRRLPCNAPLFRKVMLSHEKFKYYQINSYPYKSLKDALQRLLLRPGLSRRLEAWRQRVVPQGYLCDVYDGRLWNEYSRLFAQSRSIGMMLNLDWFQPFDHTTDSYGAIYLTIMNLPRKERFRKENVILVGVLPAMEHEPSDVNTFLKPLVQELKDLKEGERFYTAESPRFKLTFRARLLCAACDVPAGRKLCGFKGHAANLGCSRCLKQFPGELGKKDYSGFNREAWPLRSLVVHRQQAQQIRQASSNSQKKSLETATGVKYSVLLELDYFNPIRFNIIDPMHNLFLGTAKTILRDVWLSRGIISHKQLDSIQTRVNCVVVPPNIGRIPRKIASSFAEFTAEQWKNWTNIYSLFALRDLLPTAHYRCWEAFVLACRLLCSTCISAEELQKADLLLLQFCRKVEELYGSSVVTPNMHLHCHLRECVMDFGPIYSFWLFSFERYNGILGDFPTNKKSIEVQLMRHFEKDQNITNTSLPSAFSNDFSTILHSLNHQKTFENDEKNPDAVFLISARSCLPSQLSWLTNTTQFCRFPKYSVTKMLSSEEMQHLLLAYHEMYPSLSFTLDDIPFSVVSYTSCFLGSEKLGCATKYRTRKYSYILASPLSVSSVDNVPGQIQSIFTHQFDFKEQLFSHTFCEIAWYKEHAQRFHYGKALQIFCKNFDRKMFLPIPRIYSKFAPAFGSLHALDDHVLFVCPISRHFAI